MAGAAVGDIVQEHLDLFWAAKALPKTSKFVLLAVVGQRCKALDACEYKLAEARLSVLAHFEGEGVDSEKTWQGCTREETRQSFVALERLIARERGIMKAVEAVMA